MPPRARAVAKAASGARTAAGAANVESLWLAELQRLADGAAHELRNALNGVAVNLEVVRSRSSRAGTAADTLGSFAGAAAEQLDQVIAMTEALVALTRPLRQPASVGRVADQVVALLHPPAVASGRRVSLVVEGEGATGTPADVVRLLVSGAIRAVVEAAPEGGEVRCRVGPVDGVELDVTGAGARPLRLDEDWQRVADAHAVRVAAAPGAITLTFPA